LSIKKIEIMKNFNIFNPMRVKTLSLLFMVFALLLPIGVMAQMFGGPPAFSPDVLDNPIDGGLGLLLGAGAIYGGKKLRDWQRTKGDKPE
jgi:hypothetical protein